jgi:ElaB/YqjD/DUF883 family membrane-anchored ribosome-binding protein
MMNRIPKYLPAPNRKAMPSHSASPKLLDVVQMRITDRMRVIEAYVQEHPVTGIGAALCIGIFLGWFIKRS